VMAMRASTLNLGAWRDNSQIFSGSPALFNAADLAAATSTADDWHFEVKFAPQSEENITNGSICRFDIVFNAWQSDIANKSDGFHSSTTIPVSIRFSANAPAVKVVYPNGGEQWYIVDDECVKYDWCRNWCATHGMNSQCEYEILWTQKIAAIILAGN